jgi:hypothetical protein
MIIIAFSVYIILSQIEPESDCSDIVQINGIIYGVLGVIYLILIPIQLWIERRKYNATIRNNSNHLVSDLNLEFRN